MQKDMDHTTPTKDELKLIIDNSLLEQEKRITKSLAESLSDQNKIYMDNILSHSERITKLEVKVNGFKGLVTTVAAAVSVVSGLIGFFIAQLTK